MRIRIIFVLSFLLGLGSSLFAQSPVYLFKEFTDGSVALNNRTFVKTKFNYDTFHDKLLYMDGDQIMELSDYTSVLSVQIGDRSFIPQGDTLYEVIDLEEDSSVNGGSGTAALGDKPSVLLVKWHQKKNPIGKKGAYGQVNHASSAISIDPEYYSISLKDRGGEQAFDTVVANTYGIMISGGKIKKFTDKRSFLRIFPQKKDQIEQFMESNHLLFSNPDDVVALAKFAVKK